MIILAAYVLVAGLITFALLDTPHKSRDDLANPDEFAASLADLFPSPPHNQGPSK